MNNTHDHIEDIFQSSQTQKSVELSPGAWNRLDDLMDSKQKQTSKSYRLMIMGIAASMLLLCAAYFTFNTSGEDDYMIEFLTIDESEWFYSTSEVAQLNEEHQIQTLQKLKPFYNQQGELKVKVN